MVYAWYIGLEVKSESRAMIGYFKSVTLWVSYQ